MMVTTFCLPKNCCNVYKDISPTLFQLEKFSLHFYGFAYMLVVIYDIPVYNQCSPKDLRKSKITQMSLDKCKFAHKHLPRLAQISKSLAQM